jgi:predicted enzyme related to lactoylglutathione lyase
MELHPSNPDTAKSFYGDLMGWKFSDMDMGGATYTMVNNGAEPFGGIAPANGGSPHWLPYLGVEDLDATTKKAELLGAKVIQPRVDIPAGSFVVLQDPMGAAVALFQTQA